jgi:hypothetical protein
MSPAGASVTVILEVACRLRLKHRTGASIDLNILRLTAGDWLHEDVVDDLAGVFVQPHALDAARHGCDGCGPGIGVRHGRLLGEVRSTSRLLLVMWNETEVALLMAVAYSCR